LLLASDIGGPCGGAHSGIRGDAEVEADSRNCGDIAGSGGCMCVHMGVATASDVVADSIRGGTNPDCGGGECDHSGDGGSVG